MIEIEELTRPIFSCVSCGRIKGDQYIDLIYKLKFVIEYELEDKEQYCTSLILCEMCMHELSNMLYLDIFDPGNDD